MRQELEIALSRAQTLPPEELPSFLGALEEVRTTALARLSAPVPFKTAPNRELPEVLDVDQAAAYIGMSRKWIYRHYEIIPHIRVGFGRKPRLKFRRRDLDAWLEEHRVGNK